MSDVTSEQDDAARGGVVLPDPHTDAMQRVQACTAAGIPTELASRLQGDTPQELAADAQQFAQLRAERTPTASIGAGLGGLAPLPQQPSGPDHLLGALTRGR